jgi:hypothetical protein
MLKRVLVDVLEMAALGAFLGFVFILCLLF